MYKVEVKRSVKLWDCCVCGGLIALVVDHEAELRRTRAAFYCPVGHSQNFGETEADRLRKKLNEAELEKTRLANQRDVAQRAATAAQAARAEAECAQKRLLKTGVCPCCTRNFVNLRRHMQTKHPEVVS